MSKNQKLDDLFRILRDRENAYIRLEELQKDIKAKEKHLNEKKEEEAIVAANADRLTKAALDWKGEAK